MEVERAIFTFTVAAEESTRIHGEYLPLDWQEFTAGRWGIVKRFPLVRSRDYSFHFPLIWWPHKWRPPSPPVADGVEAGAANSGSCLRMAEVVQQAGWPDGALNVLPLSNDDASPAGHR